MNWLSSCYYKGSGAILADEMGLGKTVQIVSYLEHLYRVEKLHGPFLVVVPLSTVEHWRREFEGWTDMQCCVYHDRQVRPLYRIRSFSCLQCSKSTTITSNNSVCGAMSYASMSSTTKIVRTLLTISNSTC